MGMMGRMGGMGEINASTSVRSGSDLRSSELPRKHRLSVAWILGGCVAVAGMAILFWFDPAGHGFYPVCAFHQVTGLLCPGCGATRALHQILHGHLTDALRLNAFFVCSI